MEQMEPWGQADRVLVICGAHTLLKGPHDLGGNSVLNVGKETLSDPILANARER